MHGDDQSFRTMEERQTILLLKCLSVGYRRKRNICQERMDGAHESHGWIRLCGSSAFIVSSKLEWEKVKKERGRQSPTTFVSSTYCHNIGSFFPTSKNCINGEHHITRCPGTKKSRIGNIKCVIQSNKIWYTESIYTIDKHTHSVPKKQVILRFKFYP